MSLLWIGAAFFAVIGGLTAQTTHYVVAGAVSPGQGTLSQPFPDIQSAISAATSGDAVVVSPGTYFGTIDFLGKDLDLSSSQGPSVTTIDAIGVGTCVRMVSGESSNARLRGFTISNGSAAFGGGIRLLATSPRIEDCVITQNSSAVAGGGLHADGATPTIVDCTFIANQSLGQGGAIASVGGSNPQLRRCTILGNTASQSGGGIAVVAARIVVEDGTIEANVAQSGDGGAIYLENSVLTAVRRSVIRSNTSVSGGGIAQRSGNLIVEQCSFLSNTAADFGGAVDLFDGTSTFSNSVFAGQTAGSGGGAVMFRSVLNPSSTAAFVNVTVRGNSATSLLGGAFLTEDQGLSVKNSIVWENGVVPIFEDAGASITMSSSTVEFGFPGAAILSSDPLNVHATAFDFRLQPASPCRDVGDASAAAPWLEDHAGRPRSIGSGVDHGAVEFAPDLPGSHEDLVMISRVNDRGASVSIHAATAGAPLEIAIATPNGTYIGNPPIIFLELFATGSQPIGPTVFPEIHLSVAGAVLVFNGEIDGATPPTLLATDPIVLSAAAPTGLSGLSIRLQSVVADSASANGFFTVSDAHEIVFL